MRKLIVIGLITLLAISGIAFAAPEHKGAPDFVPQLTEDQLTKVVLIHYAPGFEKPAKGSTATAGCYKFLAGSRPKWNWVEGYAYSTADLGAVSSQATLKWDAATSKQIFGTGVSGSYPWGVYDYKNSISYGNYQQAGVIAVTAYWYKGQNLYEYDIMFDTDYFPGDGSVDLSSVALHEFGHAAGLGDLYSTTCSKEVMYGYYNGVDATLGNGDKAGIYALYGA
jgi:hypothetical protein